MSFVVICSNNMDVPMGETAVGRQEYTLAYLGEAVLGSFCHRNQSLSIQQIET